MGENPKIKRIEQKKRSENMLKHVGNVLNGVLFLCVFVVLLVCGCFFLYDRDVKNGVVEEYVTYATEEVEQVSAAQSAVVYSHDFESSVTESTEDITITFSFLGDCILSSDKSDTRDDTLIETAKYEADTYFFEKAKSYYSSSDFVVANCEFVMSNRTLSAVDKDGTAFWFKSPTSFASILRKGGIDIVTLANNHTYDYSEEGYVDTKAALESEGITWGDLANPVYVEKDGITFGIICTNLFTENYMPTLTPIVEEVIANSDVQIMYFHGGEEYSTEPEEWLVNACHTYADMGVDLIVGSHPHVLRPMENYNGVDIFYSLGNFCYGANRTPENQTIVLTETFTFSYDGTYIGTEETIIPFYVYTGETNNWQPAPIEDEDEINEVLEFMYSMN